MDYRRIKPVRTPEPYRLYQDWSERWGRMARGEDARDEHDKLHAAAAERRVDLAVAT